MSKRGPPSSLLRSGALPWLVWAALAVRLLVRVRAFAVDLFFWDEWDYRAPFFSGASAWELFRWEHTTHRMGLGNLFVLALQRITAWDARAEPFACAVTAIAAAALGIVLYRRLFGPSAWACLAPLCLLTGLHADAAAGAAALSFAPLPLLLVLAFVLVAADGEAGMQPLAFPARVGVLLLRDGALLVLDFLAVFTGYGLLLAPFSRGVFVLWAVRDRASPRACWIHLGAALASVATLVAFARGYVVNPTVECFVFPWPHPVDYLGYAALVLERPLGISGVAGLRAVVVYGTALAIAAATGAGAVRLAVRLRRGDGRNLHRAPSARLELQGNSSAVPRVTEQRRAGDRGVEHAPVAAALAVVLLGGFSLVFAALASFGRVCLGVTAAAAPRYVAYAVPGLFAVVLAARAFLQPRARDAALSALLAIFVAKEALVTLRPIRETQRLVAGKRAFRACFLARGDVRTCEAETGFEVHPFPERAQVQEKLDWLRARRLGMFR